MSGRSGGLVGRVLRCLGVASGLSVCLGAGCSDDQTGLGGAARASGESTDVQWLTEITIESGLDFVHESGATGGLHLPEIVGGGIALWDFDNDGDLDVYLVNGNRTLPDGGCAESPTNRLYRQEDDGRFTDVTSECGLGDGGYGMGVAIGDIDNDG
ncbi:MAG: VCBS repeat-containing protein, partial [Planctomycetes bacterium]|nr:VCBS repeat-containing protein [Planctomycetota bacterium]